MNTVDKESPVDAPKPGSDMREVLQALVALGGKPIQTLTPTQARLQPSPADAVKRVMAAHGQEPTPDMGVITHEISIPGATGPLPARVYRPKGSETEKLPVILYWHGGGWVIGDIDSYDTGARALARQAKAVVISCHYRQAPEHKFPAAHDDAFAQYKWVLGNTAAFSSDRSYIAVAGESAGGNLAIGVAMMARDEGIIVPKHIAVAYPVAGTDMNTPSYRQNADASPLNKPMMEWFFAQTFASPADAQDSRINLVKANLGGLPSVSIVLAEIDPLRSEGEELARCLREAGSDVRLKIYRGVAHEFFGMGAVVDDAQLAEKFLAAGLKQAFGTDKLL